MFGSPKKQIERYFAKNPDVKSIVVLGSFGRKSAIHALGTVLGQDFVVTVGVNKKVHPDVVLLDFCSMAVFPEIQPDLAVITGCSTDADAQRFFAVANRARHVVLNYSDVPAKFAKYLMNSATVTYGDELPAEFYFENHDFDLEIGYSGDIVNPDRAHLPVKVKVLGEHNIRPVIMAAAVASLFQMTATHITAGIEALTPLNGRMQPCRGLNNTLIIDDSADTGETSVFFGLRAIYALDASSRIVVTDDLAKLGDFDRSFVDRVFVLGAPVKHKFKAEKIEFFPDELALVNRLGQYFEENGLVLLEIPLPQIIETRLWE